MIKGLVSIIVPCYNAENYISKFLDSLMSQDYKEIELIIVDDGSTDKSSDVIHEYISSTDLNIIYVYQQNSGLPSAINKGLQYVKGEFLTWSDPDDYLYKNSILTKVNFLNNDKEHKFGFVRTKVTLVDEGGACIRELNDNGMNDIFECLLFEQGVPLTPGNYLLRMSNFMSVLPSVTIMTNVRGQNWQLLLPMAYNFKCGFIDEALNYYLVRSGSMSHSDKSLQDEFYRCDEHRNIIIQTISRFLIEDEFDKIVDRIERKYLIKKLFISMRYDDKVLANEFFKKITGKPLKIRLSYRLYNIRLFKFILALKNHFIKSY
jgi:glycosyltransferase involved in cell wall biosynthesis